MFEESSTEFEFGRTTVRLSPDLPPIPASELATQTTGVIAGKGAGKTYTALRIAEDVICAGIPLIVFDPVGNWGRSLRFKVDGVSPGLPVVVLGGDEGDLPLDAGSGAALGEHLAKHDGSVVFDLSSFSKNKRKQFVADFCESFFLHCKRRKQVRLVVFEEAQMFAPQMYKGEERMLGAVTELVRIGRNRGIGVVLVSQRPASINKEVLNMVELLLVGQLRGSHERKAIAAWVTMQSEDLSAQLSELPHLEVGEFFLWSPSWLRKFQKIRIAPRLTFDGTATPEFGSGEERRSLDPLAKNQFLTSLYRAFGSAEIGAETREAETTKPEEAPVEESMAEHNPSVWDDSRVRSLSTRHDELEDWANQARADLIDRDATIRALQDELGRVRQAYAAAMARVGALEQHWERVAGGEFQKALAGQLETLLAIHALPPWLPPDYQAMDPSAARVERRSDPPPAPVSRRSLPAVGMERPAAEPPRAAVSRAPKEPTGEYRDVLLNTLWAYGPLSRLELQMLSGRSKNSSAFNETLAAMLREELVQLADDKRLRVTSEGKKLAKKPPLQKGRELFEYWQGKLDDYDALLFRTLWTVRNGLSRPDLADRAGRSIKSSAFNESVARLKSRGFVEFTSEKKIRVTDFLRQVMT